MTSSSSNLQASWSCGERETCNDNVMMDVCQWRLTSV